MRSLQSAARAILLPLLVLVLCTVGITPSTFAVSAPSSLLSGATTLKTLSLEEDSAILASGPEDEVAKNIAIRAVNPGYTTESGKNSGELIELVNLSGEEVPLDGIKLIYKSKTSANPTVLYEFPDGAKFVGESILLRYSGAPEATDGAQDLKYDTSLAMAGSLALTIASADSDSSSNSSDFVESEEIISQVCWMGGENCLPVFSTTVKSRAYTTILRDSETGEYSHVNDPELLYDPDNPGLYLPPETSDSNPPDSGDSASDSSSSSKVGASSDFDSDAPPACSGLEFSEILTYYSDDRSEQFIELYNNSEKPIDLSNCSLHYKKKFYKISSPAAPGLTASFISSGAYYVYHPEITLTKNPTSELLFEIMDINGDVVDSVNLPHGQKKKTSYALTGYEPDGSEIWQTTYNITPGKPNSFQEFQTCPAGKVINVLTGNCVNTSTMKSSLNDCGAGKYRNPETGRCKSYSSKEDEQTPCQEGYERNPETNRCRKIKNNSGADYPVVPITDTEDQTAFIALWAILAIAGLGLIYVLFQFRREIFYSFRHLITKIRH